MTKKIISSLLVSAFALAALPANAGSVSDQIDQCAAAIDAEQLVVISDYRVKFLRISGGAAKRLSIELIPYADGESLRVECKIRRGEVQEVSLKS